MPREARRKSSTDVYHVINRGINKLPIFNSNREKTRFQNLIKEYQEKYNVQIYAYCIMSNHFHLLVKADLEELASFMARILAIYAIYYNKLHKRNGYVFQGRYRSQCIESEKYFWNCVRYIHRNPMKTSACKSIEDYKYSSLGEYYGTKKVEIIDTAMIKMFHKRFDDKEIYRFHETEINENILFLDIPDEEFAQQKERAEKIFEQMQKDFQMEREEIFDDVTMRNLLDNIIRQCFDISLEQAKKIRKSLENDITK